MPTYFMNIRVGEDIALDPEGAEYGSLQEAREDAIASARELSADALRAGAPLVVIAGKVFEIRNEMGALLLSWAIALPRLLNDTQYDHMISRFRPSHNAPAVSVDACELPVANVE